MRRLVVALVVLLALAVGADRLAAWAAGRAASQIVAQNAPFAQPPTVSVHGFPFLTQAVGGTYQDVEVAGSDLRLGTLTDGVLDAHFHGVHLPLSNLVHRRVTQLSVDSADGTLTLPYTDLAALSGVQGLTLKRVGGDVVAAAELPVDGRPVPVRGTARVVMSGSTLRLQVDSVTSPSGQLPDGVAGQLAQALSVPITLPQLPYGLHVRSVSATDTGVRVSAAGSNLVLG